MVSQVQQRIDALGRQLGRSVVLNDREIRLVYASEHFGDEDPVRVRAMLHRNAGSGPIGYLLSHGIAQWSGAGRVPASAEHELASRVVVPVRHQAELLGFVVVIEGEQPLAPDEIAAVEEFARDSGRLIVTERHAQDERSLRLDHQILAWLGTVPAARAEAARTLAEAGVLAEARHVRALVVEAVEGSAAVEEDQVDLALRHAVESVPRSGRTSTLHAVGSKRGVLVMTSPVEIDDDDAERAADAIVSHVSAFAGGRFSASVGIGSTVRDPEHAWRSRRQAELACRAVPVVGPGRPAHWEQLGPLGVLLRIPAAELDETSIPPAINTLIEADPHGRLLETLETFLGCGGSGSAAAQALHVHRTTLYYRLDRIRDITGVDLDDGSVRLELHLGVLLRRLLAVIGTDEGQ